MSNPKVKSGAGGTVWLTEKGRTEPGAGEQRDVATSEVGWSVYGAPVFRCEVRLRTEPESVSVYVPALPGVASQGDSDATAIAHVKEALEAAIETYLSRGDEVPWIDPERPVEGERSVWVVVHG